MKKILAILLAVLMLAGTMPIYAQEAEAECEHEYFNACDGVCMNCGEVTREATHELTHVPEVVATDCLHPGNIEYYKCSKCGGYYTDAEGYEQINPWYVETSVDCVRPEDAADCAVIPCAVCGNDTYGNGEHDFGDSFACQGGTCLKCGDNIYGCGCENDGPYCTDGHCIFCGEVVEGWGHENGAWAPCMNGVCSYGCGLEYPATAEHNDADGNGICDVCYFCAGEHVFENGFDPCYGGTCSRCWAYFEGEHTFANPCDTYCVVCEEDVRDPAHELIYVAAVEPIDCQTPGNIEHWYCEVCEGYFADEKGINQYNPWYIPVTADCVRPEGSADCATVNCEVCGEELYGYGEHDLGENFACQGGTCLKCGEEIAGYGCANYDTPACMDGVCYYCGGFVAGLGHENGAWAPCIKGECSYGCGLEYPATAEHIDNEGDGYCDTCWNHLNHTFENGFDPCYGGECSVCFTFVEGEHDFEDTFTTDVKPTEEETGLKSRHCKNCDEVTDITEIPVIKRGDINGDNRVNSRDLLALKKYLANSGTIEYIFNADIDGNGRINGLDTMRLNKILKPEL